MSFIGGTTASVALSNVWRASDWAVQEEGGTEGKCQTNVKYTRRNGKLSPKRSARSGEKYPSLSPSCFSNRLAFFATSLPCRCFPLLPSLRALRLALARISSLIVLVSGSAGVSSYIFTSAFYRAYRGLLTALAVSYLPAVYSADTFFQRCSGHSQLACLARPWIF